MAKKPEENTEVVDLALPDYLKNRDMSVNTADTDALTSIANKIPRISLKGRKFRLIVEGEEIIKPRDELDITILAVEPEKGLMAKTFYEKGYASGDSEPPTCSSADGVNPDSWVNAPQNPTCRMCAKNQFGSATAQSGKPSKACRDSKTLSVGIPNTKNQTFDEDLKLGIGGTIFKLSVPVTSLGSLSEFGKIVSKNQLPLAVVVAKLEMVDSEYPQVKFAVGGFLEESEGLLALERNVSRDWKNDVPSGPLLENSGASSKPQSLIDAAETAKSDTTKSGDVNAVIGEWENG